MTNLVFFLEGRSEKEMLKGLLPNMLPSNIHPIYCTFNGKKDLEDSLCKKIQGWRQPKSVFIVLLDQDQEPCKTLKKRIIKQCEKAKTSLKYIVRIACHELESWYFGDLKAVGRALDKPRLFEQYKNKRVYKKPDKIQNPAKELVKITNNEYQKISGSRAIGPLLSLDGSVNKSPSFKVFIKGITQAIQHINNFKKNSIKK